MEELVGGDVNLEVCADHARVDTDEPGAGGAGRVVGHRESGVPGREGRDVDVRLAVAVVQRRREPVGPSRSRRRARTSVARSEACVNVTYWESPVSLVYQTSKCCVATQCGIARLARFGSGFAQVSTAAGAAGTNAITAVRTASRTSRWRSEAFHATDRLTAPIPLEAPGASRSARYRNAITKVPAKRSQNSPNSSQPRRAFFRASSRSIRRPRPRPGRRRSGRGRAASSGRGASRPASSSRGAAVPRAR